MQSRIRHAYLLKISGMPLAEIAERLDFPSSGAVAKAIRDELSREAAQMPAETRDSLLKLQDDRLNFMLSRLWPSIEQGDPKSIDSGLKVIALQSKLNQLDVADAAQNTTNVLVIGGAESDYIEKLKELTEN